MHITTKQVGALTLSLHVDAEAGGGGYTWRIEALNGDMPCGVIWADVAHASEAVAESAGRSMLSKMASRHQVAHHYSDVPRNE